MVNFIKIKKWNEEIKKNNGKLKVETDFNQKEKLRFKIQILELRVKIEKLN
jgi:hypothetical protein